MKAERIRSILKRLLGKRGIRIVSQILCMRQARYVRTGYCNACGKSTIFIGRNAFTLTQKKERNDLGCFRCGAIGRNRALIAVVLDLYGDAAKSLRQLSKTSEFSGLSIYNASSLGAVHGVLSGLPNYVCSEYFPDIPSGSVHNGIRCEDLQALSFPDDTFDLVISEDVMEHVRDPGSALREVYRVLKPEGCYVFTVPVYGDATVVRVDTTTNADIHLLPPLYHGHPFRKEGSLAYNDFGRDIVDLCMKHGFKAQLFEFEAKSRKRPCGDVVLAKKAND